MRQGWIVAMTSYRREGLIVSDAIKDVNNLRNFICNERGYPYWVVLEGRSMGGACLCLSVMRGCTHPAHFLPS